MDTPSTNPHRIDSLGSAPAPADEPQLREVAPPPIVAIGASAGGLEALKELLAYLSPDTGMGFVVIQHLDPSHASALASILARSTAIPVLEAMQGMPVAPDHVYVIPPGALMTLLDGWLQLTPRGEGIPLPIDHFLHSLAHELGPAAVGVVLSGTGSDGARGLREIKAAGPRTTCSPTRPSRRSTSSAAAISSSTCGARRSSTRSTSSTTRSGRAASSCSRAPSRSARSASSSPRSTSSTASTPRRSPTCGRPDPSSSKSSLPSGPSTPSRARRQAISRRSPAKEELESANEELTTVNEELQLRNSELARVNDDLSNLIASVEIPIVMVGTDLRLMSFTPSAARLLGLVSSDTGRPLDRIKLPLEGAEIEALIRDVMDHEGVEEREVRDRAGRRPRERAGPARGARRGAAGAEGQPGVLRRLRPRARRVHRRAAPRARRRLAARGAGGAAP